MGNQTDKNYYDLLGVSTKASGEEIKAAFQERINRYAVQMNAASRDFDYHSSELKKAYQVLSSPIKRSEYNKTNAIE